MRQFAHSQLWPSPWQIKIWQISWELWEFSWIMVLMQQGQISSGIFSWLVFRCCLELAADEMHTKRSTQHSFKFFRSYPIKSILQVLTCLLIIIVIISMSQACQCHHIHFDFDFDFDDKFVSCQEQPYPAELPFLILEELLYKVKHK